MGHPLAEAVIQGYNATCFAYGQTGSGKVRWWTLTPPRTHPKMCLWRETLGYDVNMFGGETRGMIRACYLARDV